MKSWDVDYLRKVTDRDAIAVLREQQEMRTVHRHHNNGYSKDRTRRHIASFDPYTLFHPEFKKYFDPMMDDHERKKNMYAFLRKYPDVSSVDKL